MPFQPTQNPMAGATAPKIREVRPSTTAIGYDAPNLFPLARSFRGGALEQYIETRMIELAEAGTLKATDLLNQDLRCVQVMLRIVRGERIEGPERIQTMHPDWTPPILREYPIKLRARTRPDGGKYKIRWKKGMEPARTQIWAPQGSDSGAVGSVAIHEDVWYEIDDEEAVLPLPMAIAALRQYGAFCRREKKQHNKDRYWHFEEIAAVDKPAPEEPRRQRRNEG